MSNTAQEANAAIISANLVALHARLRHALAETTAASKAMCDGKQNLAIGTILDLERILPECDALYRTILLLHRSPIIARDGEVRS